MKLTRMLLALLIVAALAGVAYVGQQAEPAGAKMASAADKFLASLSPVQRKKTTFAFDDKERLRWHFTPQQDKDRKTTRKGVALEEMSAEQKKAALDLIRAGTSAEGYVKATTVMSLEAILHELEKGGRMVRNPEWYFFTIYGTPGKSGKWAWRVEGHHLALNFTFQDGKVASATPAFFGANPATVKDGPRKGLRTLPEAEDLARELFLSLDEGQRKVAHQPKHFREIEENTPRPTVGAPVGVAAANMNDKQRTLLRKLVESYAQRLPPDIAATEVAELRKAGVDQIHFAYSGGTKPGEGYTYRVQGPTFVVEFLNLQADGAKNPANHIHSAWRSLKNDFGAAN